ncbi:MAG: hypothetical protein ACO1NZ_11460 [Adhaeribacter sp.]
MKKYCLLPLLLLLPLLSFAAEGKKVIIQPIMIDNNYEEVTANPFAKADNESRFLQALEQQVQQKLGSSTIQYLGQKKIWLVDKSLGENPQAAMADFQEMYRQKKSLQNQAYDLALSIQVEIADIWKGRQEHFQVMAKVVGTDRNRKKVFKHKAVVHVNVPPVPFALSQLNETGALVYEGFPLNEEKLQQALLESISLALAGDKKPGVMAVERRELPVYAGFLAGAQTFRLAMPNNYGRHLQQSGFFNLVTFARSRPLLIQRLSDHKTSTMGFRNLPLREFGFDVGWSPVYTVAKKHKYLRLSSQTGPGQEQEYLAHAVLTDKKALTAITWQDPIEFTLKTRQKEPLGEFRFQVSEEGRLNTLDHARSLSRVYHPWSSLQGQLAGRQLSIRTNPYALNAVEIQVEGQLVALVMHAAAPKKYLRKGKNQLPYFISFAPDVEAGEQELLLQSYQLFHLAQALQQSQDLKRNKL